MKKIFTIWNNIPAWGKALIFLGIVGMPIRMIIFGTAAYNLENDPGWGWAILVAFPLLFVFWEIVSRWSPFDRPDDVKISTRMDVRDIKVWSRMLGLILLTISGGVLFTELFGVRQDHLEAALTPLKQAGDATAVPLFITFALTAGIVEEVVFRGYVQNTLVRAYPKAISFLVIALVFALLHFLPIPLVIAFLIISSAFSLVADEFKSLGVVIIAHIIVDIIGLLGMYYGTTEETGPMGIVLSALVFAISLIMVLRGNKALSFKQLRKTELSKIN